MCIGYKVREREVSDLRGLDYRISAHGHSPSEPLNAIALYRYRKVI